MENRFAFVKISSGMINNEFFSYVLVALYIIVEATLHIIYLRTSYQSILSGGVGDGEEEENKRL